MSRVEIYRDSSEKHRWRFTSNGRVMADSGQGYSRRIDCLNGCATVLGCPVYVYAGSGVTFLERSGGWLPVHDLTRQP